MSLALARMVADAVLYEGYLLYPYRASSSKNQMRWQFGVLGPVGALAAGYGEAPAMSLQCLLCGAADDAGAATLTVHLRFLQLQHRQLYDADGRPVDELRAGDTTEVTWDEAVEQELTYSFDLAALADGATRTVHVDGGEEVEQLRDPAGAEVGRVVRRRWPLSAELTLHAAPATAGPAETPLVDTGYGRLDVDVRNTCPNAPVDKDQAIRSSLIGAHLLIEADGVGFVSLVDPPADAADLAGACTQDRCWPVLTGAPGDTNLLLGSPIILYDYPEIAGESAGALFDGTEIDEILTLRVMTMTEQEKAEARATDPRAREIIDRCDQLGPEALQLMHGVLRNPHAGEVAVGPGGLAVPWPTGSDVRNLEPTSFDTGDVPWWSPEADDAVQPGTDSVTIEGVRVARDSLVRVHPSRRADAQDLFFADQVARVTAVLSDVDGGTHVALVLLDDPAADLNDLAGRYWYFDPDELTPLSPEEEREVRSLRGPAVEREESRP